MVNRFVTKRQIVVTSCDHRECKGRHPSHPPPFASPVSNFDLAGDTSS